MRRPKAMLAATTATAVAATLGHALLIASDELETQLGLKFASDKGQVTATDPLIMNQPQAYANKRIEARTGVIGHCLNSAISVADRHAISDLEGAFLHQNFSQYAGGRRRSRRAEINRAKPLPSCRFRMRRSKTTEPETHVASLRWSFSDAGSTPAASTNLR